VWLGCCCNSSKSSIKPSYSIISENLLSLFSSKWCFAPFARVLSSPSRATASILTSFTFSTLPNALIRPFSTKTPNYWGLADAVQLLRAQTASFFTCISSFMRTAISLSIIPESRHACTCSCEPAVMLESTQHDSFLTDFFWWLMIWFNAGMSPASIATCVWLSSPVTMLPIVLNDGIAIATF